MLPAVLQQAEFQLGFVGHGIDAPWRLGDDSMQAMTLEQLLEQQEFRYRYCCCGCVSTMAMVCSGRSRRDSLHSVKNMATIFFQALRQKPLPTPAISYRGSRRGALAP